MISLEALAQLPESADWIRGKAYFRNQRVHNLTVSQSESETCLIQAVVHASEHYYGRITLQDTESHLVAWQCSCPHHGQTPCRHIVAILLQYAYQIKAPGLTALMILPQNQPLRLIEKMKLKTDVHILFRYQKQTDQILVFPRLIYRDAAGHRIMSLNPCDPDDYVVNSQVTDHTGLCRDHNQEQAVIDFFEQWGDIGHDQTGCLTFDADENLSVLISQMLPALPVQWHVLYDAALEKMIPQRKSITIDFSKLARQSVDLLAFNLNFHCDCLAITPDQLQAYLNSQQKWLLLNGQFIEVTNRNQLRRLFELLERFRSTGPASDCYEGQIHLAAELAQWFDADQVTYDKSFKDMVSGLSLAGSVAAVQIPDRLDRILRSYQRSGVQWLSFLRQYGLGGILADDMGLGKTLQVLTALAAGERCRPSLIICPKTLMFNWLNEAKRFVPELKTVLVHGPQTDRRRLLRQAYDFDLIITSYSLVQIDLPEYLKLTFNCCILDEAQMIKNPETHLARHVKKIAASQRIALTGTPMENDVLDLWSIFDFVLPGYLGKKEVFRVAYTEANRDQLLRRIRPFLLRRTKSDVLPELPPKIEETVYTSLTQNQLALYQQTLHQIRKDVSEVIALKSLAQARITILAGLTRLRQICNHPGLIHEQYQSVSGISGKLELFDELLRESLDNHHKVLVFSQFTRMLAIIRRLLDSRRIPCCYLDGKTRNRQEEIVRFNSDPTIPVFLISLKTGGFGLNLTAADTIILVDPWWNPMVEEQAADRAHRIGQSRVVTVYRLITQGTIEEKMELLQSKKRLGFDQIVNQAARQDSSTISIEDLQSLIS